jgi:hypothetical protein
MYLAEFDPHIVVLERFYFERGLLDPDYRMRRLFSSVSDPDPDWILIQKGKNDLQK